MFFLSLICALILWIAVFLVKVDVKNEIVHIKNKSYASLIITRTLSGFSYSYALKYGNLAVSNYISGMSVVLIVMFGVHILNERDDKLQKYLATAIALVGMTIIFVSKLNS